MVPTLHVLNVDALKQSRTFKSDMIVVCLLAHGGPNKTIQLSNLTVYRLADLMKVNQQSLSSNTTKFDSESAPSAELAL